MRFAKPSFVLVLGILAFAACREESEPVDNSPIEGDSGISPIDSGKKKDASTSTTDSSTPPEDSGTPDGGPTAQGTLLTTGEIEIVSTLLDGTIVFIRYGATDASLEAIAPTGGTPTVIVPKLVLEGADTDDVVSVVGGVVGVWTGVNADGIGKLSVWTKVNGLKEITATSPVYELDASEDGTRIAFVRANGTTPQLVTAPSTGAAANVVVVQDTLGDGSAANPCAAFYTFVGTDLFSSTCSGSGITATARRTGPTGTIVTIDTGLAPSFLSISKAGDKVFTAKRITAGGTGGAASVFVLGATAATEVPIETAGVAEGSISPDGTTVVYRTRANALKKAATAAPVGATELAAAPNVIGLLSIASDFKTVLSHKLAPGGTNGNLFDLQLSSVAAAAAPTVVSATATNLSFGFTRSGRYLMWVPNPAMAQLKAKAITGGADLDLGPVAVFLDKLDASDRIVVGDNQAQITVGTRKVDVVDFKVIDVATQTSKPIVKAVEIGALVMPGGKNVAYTEAAKGLYLKAIP
jgi:hypothetical protein